MIRLPKFASALRQLNKYRTPFRLNVMPAFADENFVAGIVAEKDASGRHGFNEYLSRSHIPEKIKKFGTCNRDYVRSCDCSYLADSADDIRD